MPTPLTAPLATTSASTPVGGSSPTSEAATAPASGLGKDDFLQLLVGQLRNQNPMNPVADQEFMAQMAAFSTLEQVTNLAASNQRLEDSAALDQALGLVGREVSYTSDAGTTAAGLVERVVFGEDGYTLTVGGIDGIAPAQVTEVR